MSLRNNEHEHTRKEGDISTLKPNKLKTDFFFGLAWLSLWVTIDWILKNSCLQPVLLLHSPFLFPSFLGGNRKGVRNNQLSYKTWSIRNSHLYDPFIDLDIEIDLNFYFRWYDNIYCDSSHWIHLETEKTSRGWKCKF